MSTPFNKRLISSTPDPERLAQAELHDLQQSGLVGMSQGIWQHENPGLRPQATAGLPPQLIPERDTESRFGKTLDNHNSKTTSDHTGGHNAAKSKVNLANELFERLKQQRQCYSNSRSEQKVEDWKQELRKHQDGNKKVAGNDRALDLFTSVKVTDENSQQELEHDFFHKIPKAEWVTQSGNDGNFFNNPSVYSSQGERSWNILKMDPSFDLKKPTQISRKLGQLENSNSRNRSKDEANSSVKSSKSTSKDMSRNSNQKQKIDQVNIRAEVRRDAAKVKQKTSDKQDHTETNKNTQKSKPLTSNAINSSSAVIHKKIDSKPLEIPSNSSSSDADSVYQSFSQTTSSRASERMVHSSAFKPVNDKDIDFNDFRNVVKKLNEAIPDLNLTADTCDEEVNRVVQSYQAGENVDINQTEDQQVQNAVSETPISEGNNLSQVIELLKTEAFATQTGITTAQTGAIATHIEDRNENIKHLQSKNPLEKDATHEQVEIHEDRDSGVSLQTPRRPEQTEDLKSGNKENSDQNVKNEDSEPVTANEDKTTEGVEMNTEEVNTETNVNQNCRNVNNNQPKPQRNLQYLDKMADPYLRETACRLAFKAAAISELFQVFSNFVLCLIRFCLFNM